jgi:hypothetical protein
VSRRLAPLALASLLGLGACESPVTPLPRDVSVAILNAPDSMGVGDSLRLRGGVLVPSDPSFATGLRWASRAPGIVAVDSAGHARGVAVGEAWIVARPTGRARDLAADSALVVITAQSRSLLAFVSRDSLTPGDTVTVRTIVHDLFGGPVPAGSVRFASSDTLVARVDSLTGLVHVRGDGDVVISASDGMRTARVTLRAYLRPLETGGVRLASVAMGRLFGCGLDEQGAAYCWGRNHFGQLGRGTMRTGGAIFPFAPVSTSSRFIVLAAGSGGACGITTSDTLECWGRALIGQVPDEERALPRVVAIPAGFGALARVRIGVRANVCVVDVAGAHACWGDNAYLNIGGTAGTVATPRPVPGAPTTIGAIATGESHGCATDREFGVFCWGGSSGWGPEPAGMFADATRVPTAPQFRQVVAGFSGTCGLDADGQAWCGGYDQRLLGDRAFTKIDDASALVRLAGGYDNACGLRASGDVVCWNTWDLNFANERLYGYDRAVPFSRRHRFVDIGAGPHQTCGITTTGVTLCRDNTNRGIQ